MTLPAAAAELGLSVRTLHRWAVTGKLPCVRVGRYLRVPRQFVDETVQRAYANFPAAKD